jgi:hypothetical protein
VCVCMCVCVYEAGAGEINPQVVPDTYMDMCMYI